MNLKRYKKGVDTYKKGGLLYFSAFGSLLYGFIVSLRLLFYG